MIWKDMQFGDMKQTKGIDVKLWIGQRSNVWEQDEIAIIAALAETSVPKLPVTSL